MVNSYCDAREPLREVAELLLPPQRLRVSQFAAEHVYMVDSSGPPRLWDPALTPYMIEPMDLFTSRAHEAIVFAGPARSGKSGALMDCVWAYAVCAAPGDLLMVQMSQDQARDYSRRRADRIIDQTDELRTRLSPSRDADNVYDKFMRNGMILTFGWPTKRQFASRDFRYVLLTDYDKMPSDVDGEGEAFALAQKRTQTFRTRGMTVAEAAPGTTLATRKWKPSTPHEMAPAGRIAELYNRGDRRRLYWHCKSCLEWYRPEWPDCITWNHEITDPDLAAETVRYVCPGCGVLEHPSTQREHNAHGIWVPEGQRLDKDGRLQGTPRRSTIASFAMEGPAAAYQSPAELVRKFLRAMQSFELTGSESSLKTFTNTDVGRPYQPQHVHEQRIPEDFEDRVEQLGYRVVAPGVRFLTAAVDVQKNRFVVQVHGWGEGLEQWLVDRFTIYQSPRLDLDGKQLPLDPGVHLEDWMVLVDQVLLRSYGLDDGSGRVMRIKVAAVDSGGAPGVTDRAYEFWRRMKRRGFTDRLMLVKGGSAQSAPRTKLSFPDSDRKDRKAKARGEVPVYMLNVTELKDTTDADLSNATPGQRFVHLPDWLDRAFFEELTAETRDPKKGWIRVGPANEAFDLFVYNRAAMIVVKAERIRWSAPPPWAQPWDSNSLVQAGSQSKPDAPAAATTPRRRRRRVRSKGV